ncbi:PAC2 family protein [Ornithinimicrobium ciconiae]|uniref:PAC2 family protein n=1 Tax=Ornithinimicrobium ciconiae TaxID=2594265 RepID=A0A516GA77_9MICO|nr:PAC2 family protein [Ornithinimicrobium ciconiae]QDO88280.1 PAC2 family protein [Ornithinimicrobium ciconiae]
MIEPSSLYHLEAEAAQQPQHAPLLHVSLEGFMDAGNVRSQVTEHLLEHLEHTVVASFDMDSLIDYRSRRPLMTFDRDNYSSFEEPSLTLYRVIDRSGQPFLLLDGMEPDFHWEAFTKAVHQVCLGFGVRRMVSAHGVPMAVPHTRPIGVTRFASDRELIGDVEPLFGQVQVPGSAEALLHLRLGEAGVDTMGAAVHVPHYLAEARFGDAAVAALDTLAGYTGAALPREELVAAAGLNRAEITKELAENHEAAEVVSALEQRYDRFVEGQRKRSLLAAEAAELPSADEIGAQFEDFLREVSDEGSPEV